jgi:hypothetical protein
MERRDVIGSGFAGVTGLFASRAAPVSQRSDNNENDTLVAGAIDQLRTAFERQFDACDLGPCREIAAIRAQQRIFLRASQKYPDFIEVGLDVWERVYDFHLKHQQPLTAARLADGRYAMTFMFTTLLLRVDQAPEYVGFGFDGEPPAAARPVTPP